MANGAEGYQIQFGVISEVAPGIDVVDLQVAAPSTALATPPIALQDLLVKLFIRSEL